MSRPNQDGETLVDIIREKDLEILRLHSQIKKLEEDNERLSAEVAKHKKERYNLGSSGKARKEKRSSVQTKVIDAGVEISLSKFFLEMLSSVSYFVSVLTIKMM